MRESTVAQEWIDLGRLEQAKGMLRGLGPME
jgi:hypothetical protein